MTEGILCPACSGLHVEVVDPWRLGKGHRAAACLDCGLLFVHPQPTREALDAYYAPEGGWQASRSDTSPRPPQTRTKSRAARAMMAALDRYFPASAPSAGARVLDFGCGTGIWINSFQDYGWETYGIEPSTDVAFVRHRRLPAIPTGPEFDLVLAYHVLEHLPRPLDTLRQLAAALRPEGYCLISVPRIDTLSIHGDIKYCLQRHNHIVAFTEACLRGLCARAGLDVVAALHDLDERFTKGRPLRMRLLARKTAAPVAVSDPVSALKPVVEAFVALRQSA